jgi:hypothetical protein
MRKGIGSRMAEPSVTSSRCASSSVARCIAGPRGEFLTHLSKISGPFRQDIPRPQEGHCCRANLLEYWAGVDLHARSALGSRTYFALITATL